MEEKQLSQLFEERGKVIKQMAKIPERAKAENRELTAAEKAEWERIDAEYERLTRQIDATAPLYKVGDFYFNNIEPLLLARTKELYEVRAEAYQTGKTKVVEMLNVFIKMREAATREQAIESEKQGRVILDPTFRHEEEKEENEPVYAGARVAGYSW